MKTEHTKGKWVVNPELLTEVIIPSKMKMEVEVWHVKEEEEIAIANARLIASAPDLYEALKAVYKDIELNNVKGGSDELNVMVSSVLARVERS